MILTCIYPGAAVCFSAWMSHTGIVGTSSARCWASQLSWCRPCEGLDPLAQAGANHSEPATPFFPCRGRAIFEIASAIQRRTPDREHGFTFDAFGLRLVRTFACRRGCGHREADATVPSSSRGRKYRCGRDAGHDRARGLPDGRTWLMYEPF